MLLPVTFRGTRPLVSCLLAPCLCLLALRRGAGTLLPTLVLGLGLAGAGHAATLIVTTTADSGAGSLRAALTASGTDGDGDVITFDPVAFAARQTISITGGALFADAGVTIQGPAAGVVLDGSSLPAGSGQPTLVFESDTATSAVSNLILQNNVSGTGLTNRFGTVTATHCVIYNNMAQSGGGVFNDGTMTLIGCTVAGNTASQAGGGIFSYGTLTLTGCTLSGNTSGSPGGGIYNGNSGAHLTLTNCAVTGNTSGGDGGGGISSLDGTLTATNCTFTGNTVTTYDNVYGGGGAIALVRGTTTLTNDIFSGDSSPQGGGDEIFFNNYNAGNPGGTLTVTRCDINPSAVYGAAYTDGGGSIDANPKFVSATDLHLQSGSPCLGAGTAAGAPATDITGATRPSPPSIGAYELNPHGVTHLLWKDTSGDATVWTINFDNSITSTKVLTNPGMTAQSIAEGSDGQVRLLWKSSGGASSVWTLAPGGTHTSTPSYGPYPSSTSATDWQVQGMAVGADNKTRLLWKDAAGACTVWTIAADGTIRSTVPYGPYPSSASSTDWQAQVLAVGADNKTRLLWKDAAGACTVWTIAADGAISSTPAYGPYGDYQAQALAVGPDNSTRLLWKNTSGNSTVWTIGLSGSITSTVPYGPYGNYQAQALAVGPDNSTRLLWKSTSGSSTAWTIGLNGAITSTNPYGPYGDYQATTLAAGN